METRSRARRALQFSELPVGRQRLIRLCQTINFGSIHDLSVVDGEPMFSPPPTVVLELKLDSNDASRPEIDLDNFLLRGELQCLLSWLDRFGNGMIERIEVRGGVPRRLFFQTVASEVRR